MATRAYLDNKPQIHSSCYIDESALVIGKVYADELASFWPYAVARGDVQSISIGKRSNVQDHALLHVTHDSKYNPGGIPLIVEDDVTIGHHARLHACTIQEGCIIGIGATILDKATIGKNTIIAAGSLVPPGKDLEPGYLWMGSPIEKKRKLTDEDIEFIYYSANNYVNLHKKYRA